MPRKLTLLTMPVVTLAFASAASALDFGPNNFAAASTVQSPVALIPADASKNLRLIASVGAIQASQGAQGSLNSALKLTSGSTEPLLKARPVSIPLKVPTMPAVPAIIDAQVTVGIAFAFDLPTVEGKWAATSALPAGFTLVEVTNNGVVTTQIRGTATAAGVTSIPLLFTVTTGQGTIATTFQLTAVAPDNSAAPAPGLNTWDTTFGQPVGDPALMAQELGFSVTVNTPFTYRVPTVANTSLLSALPAGVTYDSGRGLISGAFLTTGLQTFQIKLGFPGSSTIVTITANVTQSVLDGSTPGAPFTLANPKVDGVKPAQTYFVAEVALPMTLVFPLTSGTAPANNDLVFTADGLPNGLQIDKTGKLFGIPTITGRYQVILHVSTKVQTGKTTTFFQGEVATTTVVLDILDHPEDDVSKFVEIRNKLQGKGCGAGSGVALIGIGMLMLGFRRRR